jgi:hypothetical protein
MSNQRESGIPRLSRMSFKSATPHKLSTGVLIKSIIGYYRNMVAYVLILFCLQLFKNNYAVS